MDQKGFTLFELLLGIAILVFVGGILIVKLNPGGQLATARNSEREAHLQTIHLAIGQNLADNKGVFTCAGGSIPTSTKKMAVGAGNYNIAPCLTVYLPVLPHDPNASGAHFVSATDYDTGYTIAAATSTGVITLTAPSAELGKAISVSR